jgi:uncharacterized protein with ParB-like and HNH nuclease domain
MMEYEELEKQELKKLEELEEEEATNQAADQAGDKVVNQKTKKGGAGMKAARRKRNIEGMLERLKRLQKALKESEKLYYVELGKAVLGWYQDYRQNKATVRELEEELKAVAEMFGKSLEEPIE